MTKKAIFAIILLGLILSGGFILAQGGGSGAELKNPLGDTNSIEDLLMKIVGGVGKFIASLATIMIIVAGILYLTSAGSPERIGTAKKALTYAIIGIVIGLGASAIVSMVKDIL